MSKGLTQAILKAHRRRPADGLFRQIVGQHTAPDLPRPFGSMFTGNLSAVNAHHGRKKIIDTYLTATADIDDTAI